MRFLIVSLLGVMLTGCSITAPRDVGNANMISLGTPQLAAGKVKRNITLKVEYPAVAPDLDTYRISVKRKNDTQGYFSGTRWSEFLPLLVQSAMVEAFTQSGTFAQVNSDAVVSRRGYEMHTEIQEFSAVYTNKNTAPQAVIRIAFRILPQDNAASVKNFVLEEKVQAQSNTLHAIATAFRQAFSEVLRRAAKKF